MIDTLAQFIKDYNDGIISLGDLQRRLSFDQWKKDSRPLPFDYIKTPRSPEEIYFSKVNQQERMDYLSHLKEKLSEMDWKIICMIACGCKQSTIAEKLNVVQSTVSKHLSLLASTYPKLRDVLHLCDNDFAIESKPAKKSSSYPMDEAMHTVVDGKVVCRIPEYLREQNCESICLYCENCSRKRDNKA